MHSLPNEVARRRPRASLFFPALAAALILTGCATDAGLRDAQRLELYRSHAGAPVRSIVFLGGYNGWTPLGDTTFALWTRPSQAYLLELTDSCPDLDVAERITFRNNDGALTARLDQVYVSSNSMLPIPCTIQEIRPLDIKAIRLAEREIRAGQHRGPSESGPQGGPSGS